MKTSSFGYTDTISTEKSLNRPDLDFGNDFSVTKEDEGVTIVTNLTTPLDQPETIRWQVQEIANIYSGSGIDPSVYGTSKKGFSLVTQLNNVLRVTDSEDSTFQVDLPVSAHLVIKAPQNQYINEEVLIKCVNRLVSALYDTGQDTSRLNSLIRGAMTPNNL